MFFYNLFCKKNKMSPVLDNLEGFYMKNPLLDHCLICKATDIEMFVVQNRLMCKDCIKKFDEFVKKSNKQKEQEQQEQEHVASV